MAGTNTSYPSKQAEQEASEAAQQDAYKKRQKAAGVEEEEEDPKDSFWDKMFGSVPEPEYGTKIAGSLKRERKRAGAPD